jgi:hypothetical protein
MVLRMELAEGDGIGIAFGFPTKLSGPNWFSTGGRSRNWHVWREPPVLPPPDSSEVSLICEGSCLGARLRPDDSGRGKPRGSRHMRSLRLLPVAQAIYAVLANLGGSFRASHST